MRYCVGVCYGAPQHPSEAAFATWEEQRDGLKARFGLPAPADGTWDDLSHLGWYVLNEHGKRVCDVYYSPPHGAFLCTSPATTQVTYATFHDAHVAAQAVAHAERGTLKSFWSVGLALMRGERSSPRAVVRVDPNPAPQAAESSESEDNCVAGPSLFGDDEW